MSDAASDLLECEPPHTSRRIVDLPYQVRVRGFLRSRLPVAVTRTWDRNHAVEERRDELRTETLGVGPFPPDVTILTTILLTLSPFSDIRAAMLYGANRELAPMMQRRNLSGTSPDRSKSLTLEE
jgi:hypothetical protein